ncbi:pyruvate formate lyase activating enzyme [Sanguibacter gelidistatuariae]|uniref:Pyruvate formate-lyase-activating enzyme n=1 Tax=Sanguibacter gelidistatuariae TaxID=1814289 RepID=A0A1G6RM93_9MICO|nr:pyruvate formate-lyase-activating protein [Sanguibacter gelidistatuariae]SDD05077.1 pyruvate formate lyase activating enzyme [Sanguibacter gelidistatuariae]
MNSTTITPTVTVPDAAAPALGDKDFAAPTGRASGVGTGGLEVSALDRGSRLEQMRAGTLGSIHSWELVTAVDGPGTRMTVFFAGCPLRCLYCHNPDTLKMKNGESVTSEELLHRIKRYKAVFNATGGGLTISGGEVLMQPAFAATILAGAKELGIHTTIDTSGFLGSACTDAMLENIDLVLLDVKSGNPETYKKVTGRELQPTLDFGRRLADKDVEIWIRFVLVPGLTDDPANIETIADYAASLSSVTRVEVLAFHQMGRDKWASLGMKYELEDTLPPTAEEVERVRDQFRARGLTVY